MFCKRGLVQIAVETEIHCKILEHVTRLKCKHQYLKPKHQYLKTKHQYLKPKRQMFIPGHMCSLRVLSTFH